MEGAQPRTAGPAAAGGLLLSVSGSGDVEECWHKLELAPADCPKVALYYARASNVGGQFAMASDPFQRAAKVLRQATAKARLGAVSDMRLPARELPCILAPLVGRENCI